MNTLLRFSLLLCCAALFAAGCNTMNTPTSESAGTPADEPPPIPGEEGPPPQDVVSGVGTVRYVELEGGFYGIVADQDSARYQPAKLDSTYQQDGLRVRFRARLRKRTMTTQQWGRPVEVLKILKLGE